LTLLLDHQAHDLQEICMELKDINSIERATQFGRQEVLRLGISIAFILGIVLFANIHVGDIPGHTMLVMATVFGAYMAINIGANDVANNVGPAVGSRALTLGGAILIAAVFEAGGALIAGGDVVSTIKKGIIDPSLIANQETFIWLMMAALLAGAIWLNIATALGAPVSTTHSIVGAVLGAGIAAGGWDVANWERMGAIVASWVISPVCGGIIAAAFLFLIKRTITYKPDMIDAARKMVPLLVALMAWAFSTYLIVKGLKKIWKVEFFEATLIGLVIAAVIYIIIRPMISNKANELDNDKASINRLFTVPLIFSAALLSFAHGANDVANAVGPLAAINAAINAGVSGEGIATSAAIPVWVMLVGALGIAVGLALYGPKLIRTVGSEITELDQSRAFCIAMAAAITVIIASQLGLPVSSTHIAVGAVFGVGFLREFIKSNYARMLDEIKHHHTGKDEKEVEVFLEKFDRASIPVKSDMLAELKRHAENVPELSKAERKTLRRAYRKELVKRSAVFKIIGAWLITVPVSGALAAILYFTIRGILVP
jgi:inorganic phosphate transporter, PiT family